ncbi:MAG: benzoate/H(+) symporter BenE family transporter [Betaproteobacteria bacterium]|nr:benzoate/H(+) symporter BenE family transporter [Betaproteobacteria bacterium]
MSAGRFEQPDQAPAGFREIWRDFGTVYAANGLIGFIFAASGPVAIILSVGSRGGLTEAELASWLFGSFFVNGILSILFCWRWRQPLVFFWTIPGTVLVGQALEHLRFTEVVGAFLLTGLLMIALAFTGWIKRLMAAVPMPIVMGMVAGVFLRFGLDLVRAMHESPAIAAPMVLAFIAASVWPALGRRAPPVIAALAAGTIAVALAGSPGEALTSAFELARPVFQRPEWSAAAAFELVVPLAITVLIVQNGQGFAVLEPAGHRAPVNAVTLGCGVWSCITALIGTVSTCLTGPTNALISSSGERHRHYTAGIFVGLLSLAFGALAPGFTRLLLATPPAFIAALAGLAMLRVLQTAFQISFRERFSLGALIAFLVTVANQPIAGIGAPFWGLVFGFAGAWLLERGDFKARAGGTGR